MLWEIAAEGDCFLLQPQYPAGQRPPQERQKLHSSGQQLTAPMYAKHAIKWTLTLNHEALAITARYIHRMHIPLYTCGHSVSSTDICLDYCV